MARVIISVDIFTNPLELVLRAKTQEERLGLFLDTFKEFFVRMTDRKTFETRDIVIWENGEYKVSNKLSKLSYEAMCKHLGVDEVKEFNSFLKINWGDLYE